MKEDDKDIVNNYLFKKEKQKEYDKDIVNNYLFKKDKQKEYKENIDNNVDLNAFALVGFVLGLLSTILYWVLAIVPILAIIFSIIGIVGAEKAKQKGKGIAIAGLILGIVYTLLFFGKFFIFGII